MRRFVTFGPAFVVLLAAVVTLLGAPAVVRRIGLANTEVQIRLAQAQLDRDNILEQINHAVRNIAQAVEPTVVHIAVEGPGPRPWQRQRLSQGSGWVYDGHGYVVTNAHVVRGAPSIAVQFFDGRTTEAELVGVDTTTDIAVIRVKTGEGLFPARRATGQELSQGDRVYAFGSPFGFKFSMSEGIVSGLGRDPRGVIGAGGNGYTNFIQTDAAVNPGNSGGPLVDVNGKVVGMNVAIATGVQPSGTSEGQSSGISFAIPLETIESVVGQLISGGTVAKGFLGIVHFEDDDNNRVALEGTGYKGRGVFLRDVAPGGPADNAGIHKGDIITEFSGRKVASTAALRQIITITRPGEEVPVTIWRSGEELHLKVMLTDQSQSTVGIENAYNAVVGFGLQASDSDRGVTIDAVRDASPAEICGLHQGMIISSIENQDVTNVRSMLTVLAEKFFANGKKLHAIVEDENGRKKTVELQYRP
jgi:S1-C subfamily serine protease